MNNRTALMTAIFCIGFTPFGLVIAWQTANGNISTTNNNSQSINSIETQRLASLEDNYNQQGSSQKYFTDSINNKQNNFDTNNRAIKTQRTKRQAIRDTSGDKYSQPAYIIKASKQLHNYQIIISKLKTQRQFAYLDSKIREVQTSLLDNEQLASQKMINTQREINSAISLNRQAMELRLNLQKAQINALNENFDATSTDEE